MLARSHAYDMHALSGFAVVREEGGKNEKADKERRKDRQPSKTATAIQLLGL